MKTKRGPREPCVIIQIKPSTGEQRIWSKLADACRYIGGDQAYRTRYNNIFAKLRRQGHIATLYGFVWIRCPIGEGLNVQEIKQVVRKAFRIQALRSMDWDQIAPKHLKKIEAVLQSGGYLPAETVVSSSGCRRRSENGVILAV
jgi:hypothetical protein